MKNFPIETKRHSLGHILAMAVLDLYPLVKLGIGPAIENGFYYDFEFNMGTSDVQKLGLEDLPKIEQKMNELLKTDFKFEREEIDADEAKKIFQNQLYKLELIEELAKEKKPITVYRTYALRVTGSALHDFIDLCAGPHVESTEDLKNIAFKLTKIAGAYWKGSEKNPMLARIYGVAFETEKELENYFKNQEEAEKRDHRKLGKDLDLFSVDDYVGPGLVLWHPKLSIVREEIELYWRKEHRKKGYQYIYTPHVGLSKLWKTSGHLDFFKAEMYPAMTMDAKDKKEQTTYYVKPMNCPFHVRIYKSRPRSYRELPLRWCELGNVYRYEESGVLHGMLRVRGFTQDDAHIICREDQFVKEVADVLDFAVEMNKTFGFDKLNVYLSVRDQKNKKDYVGEDRIWNLAEKTLREVLKNKKIEYKEDVGGAKFYGPAIDLKAVDTLGREWQGTTIQLDFNLPQRFDMKYIDNDGKEKTPVMLHRTLLGSMERFVGTLIEHYAGAFPVWLAPVQIQIMAVSDKFNDYAENVLEILKKENLRSEFNNDNETISKKIRQGELQKIPYLLVVGEKEEKADTIAVRERGKGDLGTMKIDNFVKKIKIEIEKRSL